MRKLPYYTMPYLQSGTDGPCLFSFSPGCSVSSHYHELSFVHNWVVFCHDSPVTNRVLYSSKLGVQRPKSHPRCRLQDVLIPSLLVKSLIIEMCFSIIPTLMVQLTLQLSSSSASLIKYIWINIFPNLMEIMLPSGAWVRVEKEQLLGYRKLWLRYPGAHRSWHQVRPQHRYLWTGLLRGEWRERVFKCCVVTLFVQVEIKMYLCTF